MEGGIIIMIREENLTNNQKHTERCGRGGKKENKEKRNLPLHSGLIISGHILSLGP